MTDFDDNSMDEFDDFEEFDVDLDESLSTGNRKRNIWVVLGGVLAVVLIVATGFYFFSNHLLPGQNQQRYQETLEVNPMNTATHAAQSVASALQDVQTAQPSSTPQATETVRLEALTDEQVLQLSAEAKGMPTATVAVDHFATATMQAQQTLSEAQSRGLTAQDMTATSQAAQGAEPKNVSGILTVEEAMTSTAMSAATATALPKTGFVDEVGLPALLGVAALLLAVIVLTRRLRSA